MDVFLVVEDALAKDVRSAETSLSEVNAFLEDDASIALEFLSPESSR